MIGFLNENNTPAWIKESVNLPNQFSAFVMLQLQKLFTALGSATARQRLLSSSVVLLPVQSGLPAIFLPGFFLARQSSSSI